MWTVLCASLASLFAIIVFFCIYVEKMDMSNRHFQQRRRRVTPIGQNIIDEQKEYKLWLEIGSSG